MTREDNIPYLTKIRHNVFKKEISMDLTKIEAVNNWLRPITIIDVRSFLGMTSCYKCFIEGLFKIASFFT